MTAFQEGNRHVVDFILGMTFRQGGRLINQRQEPKF
jgi:hypothetical protein